MDSKTAKNNRNKGHSWERECVKYLRDIGIKCETSRYASKKTDDAKVDIFMEDDTPFNIQCKCHNTFKNPIPILWDMPQDENYNVVMMKVKNKRAYAILDYEDWFEIMELLHVNECI